MGNRDFLRTTEKDGVIQLSFPQKNVESVRLIASNRETSCPTVSPAQRQETR